MSLPETPIGRGERPLSALSHQPLLQSLLAVASTVRDPAMSCRNEEKEFFSMGHRQPHVNQRTSGDTQTSDRQSIHSETSHQIVLALGDALRRKNSTTTFHSVDVLGRTLHGLVNFPQRTHVELLERWHDLLEAKQLRYMLIAPVPRMSIRPGRCAFSAQRIDDNFRGRIPNTTSLKFFKSLQSTSTKLASKGSLTPLATHNTRLYVDHPAVRL